MTIEDGEVDGLNQGVSPRPNQDDRGIFDEGYSSNEDEWDPVNDDDDDESDGMYQDEADTQYNSNPLSVKEKEQLQLQYRMTFMKYLKLKSKFSMALNIWDKNKLQKDWKSNTVWTDLITNHYLHLTRNLMCFIYLL